MKKLFITSTAFVFTLLILSAFSWAQCPEDTVDRGECDSMTVICLDCEQTPDTGPWHVRFPFLITHDQLEPVDSVAGFVIPISWTRTNPAKYCSLSAWWNTNSVMYLFPDFSTRSVFRHILNESDPNDTLYLNRMGVLGSDFVNPGREWDTRIIEVSTDPPYGRMSIVATGSQDQRWWEGDRVLLATFTFVIEDTMTVCMDSSFWPPTGNLLWSRVDSKTYVPRSNLPECFTIGVPPQPDFAMALDPDSLEIQAGSSGNTDVNLTSLYGFASACSLSIANLPTDASADFTPDTLTPTGTSDLQINTALTTPVGVYTALVIATEMAKGIVDTAELTLNITQPPDFTMALDPDSLEIQAGSSGNTDVNLTSLYGFASTCTLTIANLPADASADFTPDTLTPTGTSNLQISTAVTTPVGVYTALVIATEMAKGVVDTAELILNVTQPPDFTMALDPDSLEIQAGSSGNTDVNLTSLYGFASTCTLTIANLPTDASADFTPDTLTPTGTSNLQISTAVTTPVGVCTSLVIATEMAKAIVDTAQLLLNITPPPDFTIEAEPDTQEVWPGSSVDYDVILTSLYGFDSPLYLSASGLPTDASAGFDPDPVTPTDTSVMTITAGDNTPPGTYDITITADEVPLKGKISHSTQVVLIVLEPDFTVEADPETVQVIQGAQGSSEIILTSLYGFDSPCTLSVSGLPTDASAAFDPDTVIPTGSSTLNITTAPTTPTGTYALSVTATELETLKGKVEHSVEVVLVVNPPQDFAIEVLPDTLRIGRGTDSSYNVTLTSINGFSSACTLEASGLPGGVVETFDPPTVVPTGTSELSISVPDTTAVGFYTVTVTATEIENGKAIQHSKDVTLLIVLPTWGFALEAEPDSQAVEVTGQVAYDITMVPDIGFTAPCTLYLDSGLPPDASFEFAPPIIFPTETSVFTVTTTASTPAGVYQLEIRGAANPKQQEGVDIILVTLVVEDFTMAAPTDTQYVVQGQSIGFDVELGSLLGFDDPCTLTVVGLPDPPDSAEFDPPELTPPGISTLTVYATEQTSTGVYILSITAVSKADAKAEPLQHSIDVILKVTESTGVEDWADDFSTPKSFALFQNQPNPFNPETNISYYLPTASYVRLTVYNVLGQRVRILFDGHQDSGAHSLLWDGRRDDGSQLSSGIYFYRMQAGAFTETKKMSLMK